MAAMDDLTDKTNAVMQRSDTSYVHGDECIKLHRITYDWAVANGEVLSLLISHISKTIYTILCIRY